jgi:serine/threonine protein kinase
MTPDRWKRTEQLYHSAAHLPESERSAYLREACPDDEELRREVEGLLQQQSAAGFLDSPMFATEAKDLLSSQEEFSPGQALGRYKIVSVLGRGGMGVVYKAEDTRLSRTVALKFLSAEFTRDKAALDRFEREARAASALNHPNICTLHDVDNAEGRPFLIMEHLEGQTLRQMIAGKPVTVCLLTHLTLPTIA